VTGSTAVTTTTTTTTVPEPWGQEAVAFLEAFRVVVPDRIDLFYSPTATYDGSPIGDLHGHDEIAHLRSLTGPLPEVEELFLSRDRAAFTADRYGLELWLLTILDGRVVHEIRETLQDFEGYWRDPDPLGPRLGTLHEDYFAAWTSGDTDRIAALYQPGAERRDSLFGSTARPSTDGALNGLEVEALVGKAARYVPVETVADLDGDGREPEEWAVFTPKRWREEASSALIVFDITGSDCSLRLLTEWDIEGDRIASEEILYDVSSLRRCADRAGVDLPGGWWTGLQTPAPFNETVTGHITTSAGSRIDFINGSADQVELVEWGLGRFATAGLALPEIAIIAFPPSERCWNAWFHTGYASLGAETVRVDPCIGEGGTADRRTVLHELGHEWEYQCVNEPTRRAFLNLRGLEEWTPTDSDVPWQEGIEQAAETIAWGLMDQPIGIKLPDTTTQDLAEAFRLLTGVEPLNTP